MKPAPPAAWPQARLQRRSLGAMVLGAAPAAFAAAGSQSAAPPDARPGALSASDAQHTEALPPATLAFPRDAGAHPQMRTEWWYITGYGQSEGDGREFGFQVTFFRTRVAASQPLRSALAARQLLFAHAAITDVAGKRLWHDQRVARWSGQPPGSNPADGAAASTLDTGVVLHDWSLLREAGMLVAQIPAKEFSLHLRFAPTQAVLLQGDQGLSRKGPLPTHASYYYSLPQLRASGRLRLAGQSVALGAQSRAWLDHEWGNTLLPPGAVGWDWIGINLQDGSALTAFRLRDAAGQSVWAGGSFRSARSDLRFGPGDVVFRPLRSWRSSASQANYPVDWQVQTPAGTFTVQAVVDDQELDSSRSTGAVYWEGLCTLRDAQGQLLGRGYLEMTGYARPLVL